MSQDIRPEQLSFLRHPVVLAALSVVVVLVVVAVALLLVGGDGKEEGATGTAPTPTGATEAASPSAGALTGEVIATANVRSGPDERYPVLGTVRNGASLEVVGRSEDEQWLQVVYPPRSGLHGWLDATFLRLNGDPTRLALATAEALPIPEVPTQPPVTPAGTPSPALEPTATESPTPEVPLPDLVIAVPVSIVGGNLVVTVQNQGKGAVEGQEIEVGVFDEQGQTLLQQTSAGVETLGPGAAIDVNTGFGCSDHTVKVLIVADLNGIIDETDNTNNQLTASLGPCVSPPEPTEGAEGGAP